MDRNAPVLRRPTAAEREKRALMASSEGRRQDRIGIAAGARGVYIAHSEGEKPVPKGGTLGALAAP